MKSWGGEVDLDDVGGHLLVVEMSWDLFGFLRKYQVRRRKER